VPWFYVDDGFSDSKPVLNMPDRHRLAACGLWVLAGSWSAKGHSKTADLEIAQTAPWKELARAT
jgi:hypothetical protein